MNSHYTTQFPKKRSLARCHKEAFNLEKESKIINPHQMDLKTHMMEIFKGKHTPKPKACIPEHESEEKPLRKNTTQ